MQNYLIWTLILAVLAVAVAGAVLFARAYLGGTSPGSLLFRQKTARRLEVIDQASVDAKRRLILIRRDDVEHLLLTGGPVDLVVETGIAISPSPPQTAEVPPPIKEAPGWRRMPTFGRAPEIDKDPGSREL